ncbi:hypothetical protein [Bradyrhizobium iriomotense]|uniref:Transposase n=1 Tax=Bradyrhizobium iriomotense TaxID=441950 RepID=A0ABQ6B9P8_9BRAD|nr:hypothetical protein [Bradyrhizobium iriomotense]GLR91089.1 hypothetical protein GCM10007857_78050 [Bradyrhizobium iriomotense]
MLTAQQITEAKKHVRYQRQVNVHEHDDCIRIAYEWLDAQTKTKGPLKRTHPIKHIIEKWGGRYISSSDVEVAAEIHPRIKGKYPHFNISSHLTLPHDDRLAEFPKARGQGFELTSDHVSQTYSRIEASRNCRKTAMLAGTRFKMSGLGALQYPDLAHKAGTVVQVRLRSTGITVLFDDARTPTVLHQIYISSLSD